MLYNAATKLYVLWFNWIEGSNFGDSYYAVAVAPSPLGPFKLVVKQVCFVTLPFPSACLVCVQELASLCVRACPLSFLSISCVHDSCR